MKKIFLSILFISALALTTGVNIQTSKASIDPECPNGCLDESGGGCYCYRWYPHVKEKVWQE